MSFAKSLDLIRLNEATTVASNEDALTADLHDAPPLQLFAAAMNWGMIGLQMRSAGIFMMSSLRARAAFVAPGVGGMNSTKVVVKVAFLVSVALLGCSFSYTVWAQDSSAIGANAKPSENSDARILRIENDLRPTLQVQGRPLERDTLVELMKIHHTPSISIAVVDHGHILWARAYGLADLAAKTPATARTIYQAGSVSKPVAASAAMQFVEEGGLGLDVPVNTELKSWRIPDGSAAQGHLVTLREVLTHTAGLSMQGSPGYAAGVPVPTLIEVLEGKPPATSPPVIVEETPGKAWKYSGGGFLIAQLLMMDTDGQTFPDLVQRRIFSRVGMTASTYEQPLPQSRRAEAAVGYSSDGQQVKGQFHTYPEMAAGGLWTTPSDLARWAIALERAYNGERSPLMSRAMARQMLTPGLGGWGLGMSVIPVGDEIMFGHAGDTVGFKATLIGWPRGERAVVAMGNSDDASAVIDPFTQAVVREYGWKGWGPQILVAFKLNENQRRELLGRWKHEGDVVTIRAEGSRLLALDYDLKFELIPLSANTLAGGGLNLTVVRGADNKVIALDAGSWGRFERVSNDK
jgi:CubicO group peptidase (beta-lactamase class C family)